MPELPEVETTVHDLNKQISGKKILDVWTDFPKNIKEPRHFSDFKQKIKNKRIQKVWRRGKNILIDLDCGLTLLIHQKMTGHLLLGRWKIKNKKWQSSLKGYLEDSVNRFIHLVFWLDKDKMLALSDLRKFAKIILIETKKIPELKDLRKLGPEPLEKSFTLEKFKKIIQDAKGKIKQVLMNQEVIAGIGNIYSDEILWTAKINPFRKTEDLNKDDLKRIFVAIKKILNEAIKLKGDSMSDYRLITGEKGGYQGIQRVYRREGKSCPRGDGGIVKRAKIGGRSAHFCPVCQK